MPPCGVRARVVVHGRVQGVCFRASTRDEAQHAGVNGWVCNRRDGAVEAVFEGEREAVERLLRFCGRGPLGAEVQRLELAWETPEGLDGFRVVPAPRGDTG